MIEVQNISKRFGKNTAVSNLSFRVEKGEILGFLGPNGAGKTTTMRILTGYLPADEGETRVAGYDVRINSLDVRRRLGYLPESAPLYTDLKVLEYLQFITRIRRMPKAQRKSRINEMAEVCGLERVLKQSIGSLSKGYRQRVGLASAIIHNPDILILDEPTSGLDPHQIIEMRQLIKDIGQEKTIILCSHILPEVSATCDRVLIINEGRLAANGTPQELTNQARGEDRIYVSLRGMQPEIEAEFRQMGQISSFKMVGGKPPDIIRYELHTANGDVLCEEMFKLAVSKNWVLTELHQDTMSLEEVFLHMVKGK